jgi:hypothetical protein
MRNRTSIDVTAIVVAFAAITIVGVCAVSFGPAIDRDLHASIGAALAKEAISLVGPGQQITIISRDTEAFPQPAIDILLKSFKREVTRAKVSIDAVKIIQVDPIRPVEVPSGDFLDLIRRAKPGQVIVSLLGPPLLSDEECARLKPVKPKIVAFCAGTVAESVNLPRIFDAGLLHAAVVTNPNTGVSPKNSASFPRTFDKLYRITRATNLPTKDSLDPDVPGGRAQ